MPGGGEHEEGLLHVSAQQSLQRQPAGAEPQPQTQSPGGDSPLFQIRHVATETALENQSPHEDGTAVACFFLLSFLNPTLCFGSSRLLSIILTFRSLVFAGLIRDGKRIRNPAWRAARHNERYPSACSLIWKSSFSNPHQQDFSLMKTTKVAALKMCDQLVNVRKS